MKIPLLSDGITSISQFGGGEGISIGWSKVKIYYKQSTSPH